MSIQTLRPVFATFRSQPSPASVIGASSVCADIGLRVAVLGGVTDVETIAAEWRALESLTPEATGFQSADWCLSWMTAARTTSPRWRIVTVREQGRLACVIPLEVSELLGARVVHWLGEPWTQYGDALVADDLLRARHLGAAWREVVGWRDVDVIKLGRVRADAAVRSLRALNEKTILATDVAPFVDLGAPSTGKGKRLRARRRRLEAMGPVRFEIVGDPVERHASVGQAVALKRHWLHQRGLRSSGLSHPSLTGLLEGSTTSDALIIARLRVGDATAAFELGLVANGHFRSLLGAHDEAFAQGSPGHLLIGETIEWCRAQGLSAYDLMLPSDDYKRRWADSAIRVDDHMIVTRMRGLLASVWFRARPAIKRSYARLPERLRRAGVRT